MWDTLMGQLYSVQKVLCVSYKCQTHHAMLYSQHWLCALSPPLSRTMQFVIRISYLSKCVDIEGAANLWNSKTMHSRSLHEGLELNDTVRLSVAPYHVLLFPASRPTVAFGRLGVNSKYCVPSHTGCTAVSKHKFVFPAIVQTESPPGQLSYN